MDIKTKHIWVVYNHLDLLIREEYLMKILTADIVTGTQDIFLYDSRLDIENGFKLILPSPTMRIFRLIKQATQNRKPILLSGVTMGGGPASWAVEAHAKAGLPVYATEQAAKTLDDDLEKVAGMGITLLSEDEAASLPDSVQRFELKDFDFSTIAQIFTDFGVSLADLAAVAVAVFDHGEAPPDVSDRQFRFDYLDERIRTRNDLRAFAHLPEDIPPAMTRLKAVAQSSRQMDVPLVVMDTAPAAVLGASFDRQVRPKTRKLVANIGNFHTLAFRLGETGVEGVFEHHTGLIDAQKLETMLLELAQGTLQHETVFNDHGHGALVYDKTPYPMDSTDFNVVVTGPRRNMLATGVDSTGSILRPYFAVPFGDMMIAGCFGLLAAVADLLPELSESITNSLLGISGNSTAPWDI
jgi:uncharacterized protein (DUF1786 family)